MTRKKSEVVSNVDRASMVLRELTEALVDAGGDPDQDLLRLTNQAGLVGEVAARIMRSLFSYVSSNDPTYQPEWGDSVGLVESELEVDPSGLKIKLSDEIRRCARGEPFGANADLFRAHRAVPRSGYPLLDLFRPCWNSFYREGYPCLGTIQDLLWLGICHSKMFGDPQVKWKDEGGAKLPKTSRIIAPGKVVQVDGKACVPMLTNLHERRMKLIVVPAEGHLSTDDIKHTLILCVCRIGSSVCPGSA